MKILGLYLGPHDQGVAYVDEGKLIFSFEEEKARGVKSCNLKEVFPEKAVEKLFLQHNLEYESFDYIAIPLPVSQKHLWSLGEKVVGKCSTVSHHKAHALGSYFTSGFTGKVVSISSDGSGTTSKGKIYLCEDGNYEEVHSERIASSGSLANLWHEVTHLLGWKGLKDEGKVVGLAAHGNLDERIFLQLKDCLDYLGDFRFGHPGIWPKLSYIMRNYSQLLDYSKEFRENLAHTLQVHTNQVFLKFLEDVREKYPDHTKICLSGGLFANVKLNQTINESNLFEEVFIHPAMGDGGLATGAALVKANEVGDLVQPFKLKDVYLGPQYTERDWENSLKDYDFETTVFAPDKVARELNEGKIVGLFVGRTEYGPRSLGNRSILVSPVDRNACENLNKRLHRDEIMPFAPVVLEKAAKEIFGIHKSSYAAEFMTLCFNCNKDWINRIPAVVQLLDSSACPQVLKEGVNPYYERIISYYEALSGLPVLLNTSLNAHGEPINDHPSQALRHLENGMIDMIVTENHIIKKK